MAGSSETATVVRNSSESVVLFRAPSQDGSPLYANDHVTFVLRGRKAAIETPTANLTCQPM